MFGAVLREILAVAVATQRFIAGAGGQQGRQRAAGVHQVFGAALGIDGLERERILAPFTVAEGAGWHLVALRVQEQLVDGRHQGCRRAVVGAQLIVAPGGGAPRRQVALDVGAAKTVDRLLRVTDQEQAQGRVVVGNPVQQVENLVLGRRRILEFIDHGQRILVDDALAQGHAILAGQRVVQALQHVGKAELARLAF
ncbi:hypothetical protein D3C85_581180 [compost metagenome]